MSNVVAFPVRLFPAVRIVARRWPLGFRYSVEKEDGSDGGLETSCLAEARFYAEDCVAVREIGPPEAFGSADA
jgi:hypothetical protein